MIINFMALKYRLILEIKEYETKYRVYVIKKYKCNYNYNSY
jgi:hypothetical protein